MFRAGAPVPVQSLKTPSSELMFHFAESEENLPDIAE